MRRVFAIVLMMLALTPLFAQQAGVGASLDSIITGVGKQYTVVKNDWLQSIAEKQYGDYRLWPILWWANREIIKNPERIEIGDKLTIYPLPFAAGAYGPAEKALIAEAYAQAYQQYIEAGTKFLNARHWVLLQAVTIEPDFPAIYQNRLSGDDIDWYVKRTGKPLAELPAPAPVVPEQPAAPAPAPVEQAPAPAPAPVEQAPAPAPVEQAPAPVEQAPAPAPAPAEQAPAPAPVEQAPAPVEQAPAPAPAPVEQAPAAAPAPAPVEQAPAPAPAEQAPAPAVTEQTPAPAPAAVEAPVVAEAPAPIVEPEPIKTVTLTFIETSDIHGALYPYNFITAKDTKTSLAQVATIVAGERSQSDGNVVLLEDGDSLQGQPTVYYYNFEKTDGTHIWSDAINYLGYDVVGIGNHDIEAGHPVYDKLYSEIGATVICANAVKDDGEPYFSPYKIIEKDGVKIAVLGMISPKIPDWLPPQFWTGLTFVDMVETAKKWVPIIMEQEKPDLLLGLFHAGVDYTYGGTSKDTPNNENAAQLVAEQVPGFDMIFVGHDHQGWDGQGWDPAGKKKVDVRDAEGKKVYIFGPNASAQNVAVATVTLEKYEAEGAWQKRIRGGLVATAGVEPDPAFIAKFQGAYDEVKSWVDRPVGTLVGKISTRESMFGDSAFVDLIHRIQLELSADPSTGLQPAEISFAAPLTFDATIPTSADGTMYVRDMFNLYQYENFLYTMELTGQQIKDFLEYSYKFWFDTLPNGGDHILAFQRDKEGKLVQDARTGAYQTATRYYNYDSAAGLNYQVDVSKPAGERIEISSTAGGSPFDLEAKYVVAINSYRGQGGGGHLTTGAGLDKTAVQKLQFVTGATTKDLRYYLLKWFENQTEEVAIDPIGNWEVVPAALADPAKALDYSLLYPQK